MIPPGAVAALHRGSKIEAIKVVRERDGVELKEAKRRVEAFLRSDPAVQASYAEMRARSGGTAWLWAAAIAAALVAAYFFWARA